MLEMPSVQSQFLPMVSPSMNGMMRSRNPVPCGPEPVCAASAKTSYWLDGWIGLLVQTVPGGKTLFAWP